MTPQPGSKLGPYEVSGALGAGGMGEVYRAHDTRLRRDVAIKVLPESLAADAERLARFEREAQLLASLNHPNIAAIYGVEESAGVRCLVLELVEGVTLAERIRAGSIPADEALGIALQMTEGLEAAHEKGVIHRDLKPSNVKVTPEGKVKILDFGLAKAFDTETSQPPDGTMSPTLTMAATRAGVIVGTAAYMSPEQAKGKPADRRADIWAFGVVLFEMLGGQQLFHGESISEILAAVIMSEVDLGRLPATTPARVKRLLARCLDRDPRRRLRDIGEARIALEEAIAHPGEDATPAMGAPNPAASGWRARLPWMITGAVVLALLGMMAWMPRGGTPVPAAPLDVSVLLPRTVYFSVGLVLALAPDGQELIMTGSTPRGTQFYRRRLDRPEAEPIPGTGRATNPFFSPDGKWLGFRKDNHLMKISLEGGPPVPLCEAGWGGGAWGTDGEIVFTKTYTDGLSRVADSGGAVETLTTPDRDRGELAHFWPDLLPGGRQVIYTAFATPLSKSRIELLSLDTREHRTLIDNAFFARYADSGHILFMRGKTLFAVPFDIDELQVTGAAVPVLDELPISAIEGRAQYTVSRTGTLAYVPADVLQVRSELMHADLEGRITPYPTPPDFYANPHLSPDGRRLAVTISVDNDTDIWTVDTATGIRSRLTFGAASDFNPIWTPDGRWIVYDTETPLFDIYRVRADGGGQPEPILTGQDDKIPFSFSSDGRLLAYTMFSPETREDIWILPMEEGAKPHVFLQTPFTENSPAFSPDGHWLAYTSDESGRGEVYVQAFPEGGRKTRLSVDGGSGPVWTRGGRDIIFRSGYDFHVVTIDTSHGFTAGTPRKILTARVPDGNPGLSYDVDPETGLLVFPLYPEGAVPRQANLILNWFETLRRLAPASGR